MTTPPPRIDPVDVAAAFPGPPTPRVGSAGTDVAGSTDRSGPVGPDLVRRLDGADIGSAEVVLSAERLTASTEWTVSGAVRFRRRIATYTRTVAVTVRREELEVEVRDVAERDGVWVGTDHRGPAVPPPAVVTGPGVFTLREEVPEVTLRTVPYERVVVDISRVTRQVQLTDTARHEQAAVSGDTGASLPPARH